MDLLADAGLEELLGVAVGRSHEGGLVEHPDELAEPDEGALLGGEPDRLEVQQRPAPHLCIVDAYVTHVLHLPLTVSTRPSSQRAL